MNSKSADEFNIPQCGKQEMRVQIVIFYCHGLCF